MPELTDEQVAQGGEQLAEFETNMPPWVLKISQARKEAQAALFAIHAQDPKLGAITSEQAHRRLMNPVTSVEQELALEFGYNFVFNGFSFAGYNVGPLLIGGHRGQLIAQERGSYTIATGLLIEDTLQCATQYCGHICSFVEYDLGVTIIRGINPGIPGQEWKVETVIRDGATVEIITIDNKGDVVTN